MNDRIICLLTELVQNKENSYLSLQDFSAQHNISLRTVQKDLVLAKQFCEHCGLSLETRYGKKVQLVGNDNGRRLLKRHISSQKMMMEDSVLYRRKEILLKLLTTAEPYSIRQLAQNYFLSPSSTAKDLKFIEQQLEVTALSLLKNHHGTTITGPRKEKLKLAETIIYELVGCQTRTTNPLETIQQLFPTIDIQLLSKSIQDAEKQYHFSLNEATLLGLLVHLLLLISDSIECHGVQNDTEIPVEIIKFCESLSLSLETDFHKNLSRKEKDYLEQYLTCMGMNSLSVRMVDDENASPNVEIEKFISHFLDILSEMFVVPLKEDKILIQRLRWHCYAMFERIDQSREIENLFIDEIKENYPAVFSGVLFALQTAHPKKYFQFSQEEIGFLVLYLQVAIERNNKGKRVIIVCMEGLVFSELISVRVKKYLPSLHVEKVVSMQELAELNLTTIDFIISTCPLPVEKPVVVVSPIVEGSDIEQITIKMQEKTLKYLALSEMADEALIFIQKEFDHKEQVLKFLCDQLVKQKIVTPSFYASVISREKKLSTELGNSFAIPHGEMTFVSESKLVVCTLKEPVLWEKKRVDCIFLLAIHSENKKQNKKFFSEFYEFIQIPDNLDQLRKARTPQEVLTAFTNQEHEI